MKPYLFILCQYRCWAYFHPATLLLSPLYRRKLFCPKPPADQYQSISYTINFWWDEVDHALSYHLQVVTPSFTSPGSLVLDTIVKKNTFSFNLNPGNYQWQVPAANGSSQTAYTTPRNFSVAATSIKQQAAQLIAPANNRLTNQGNITFQWSNLYGATKYQLEIDTNNFVNESTVIYN